MNRQQIAKLFDPQNIAAAEFLAAEDTDTVLAVWMRMLALAVRDPEGRVRLSPGLHMGPAELAEYFHCTPEALETTLRILEQLQQLVREDDGTLKLTACAGLCRRGKSKKSVVTNVETTEKETEKEKRKEAKEKSKEKKKKGIADAMSTSAREEDKTKNRLIPLTELPEEARKIVEAWNGLPLDSKLKGLYPDLLAQLQDLLAQYGEAALHKALANVAESPFLLGKARIGRGWSISFGWMLDPRNLEKILEGRYRDKQNRSECRLFEPGDEETPYENGFYGTVVD